MIRSPLNWFSLVGLYPLFEGENLVGDDKQGAIVIPGIPCGSEAMITVSGFSVWLQRVNGVFTSAGKPVEAHPLRTDVDENPDLLEAGSLVMMVIRRGERHFLRVWNRDARALKDFHGLEYFPVNSAYRVMAEYVAFKPPRELNILNALGSETLTLLPGYARFKIQDFACTLMAEEDEDGLLFSFTDLTRKDATYPGGRYLLTDKPKEGRIVMDFNLARNWPCAYTPYATCPLPPAENHLAARIEAGEKRYHN